MASVWGELKRRNVVKVAVAYAIVGWLLVQVADIFFPALQLPDWTVTFVAGLVILGFPLALILSWAYELTPEGMKRSHKVSATESITPVTGRKLDFAIIGALVLAVVFLVVDNYLLEDSAGTLPNSVAVLPFANLSPNPDDAFFAAGIHEEVLNQLVKLSGLNVIARTSMLRYEDTDKTVPEIAAELNVGTVMEGSVRYADDRVLVTAQLINPDTNVHLWSDSYNREFADIFAIQADIAMNIANAIGAEFSLAEQESIEEIPTDSSAAYALYLRAITQLNAELALEDLDRAISLDPEYAQAYGYKALRLLDQMRTADIDEEEWGPVVQEVAERALVLDATLASAHAALAGLHATTGRWAEAAQAFAQVYQLNPNDTEVLWAYGNFLRDVGEYDESVRVFERAAELDPGFSPYQLGISYRYAGNYDAAAETFEMIIEANPASATSHMQLAFTEIAGGNPDEGLRELQTAEQLWADIPPDRIAQLALGYSRLDRNGDVERLVGNFEAKTQENSAGNAQWATIYLAQDNYEQAFERLQALLDDPLGEFRYGQIKANDLGDAILDQPEWRALRDRLNAP